MSIVYQIFAFLLMFGIIVLVHEFGHFIAARMMGVRVETFSFGFGKRLLGKRIGRGGTEFRLSAIPLGGYVKMAGEESPDPAGPKADEFYAKNRGQRIFILLMGPLMNILLAFTILVVIFMTGVNVEKYHQDPPMIHYVQPDSPAQDAGLKSGDLILEVDGRDVANWQDLEYMIGANPDQTVPVKYRRNNRESETRLSISSVSEYSMGYAGVFPELSTLIENVESGSPAERAGIRPGDRILGVGSQPVNYFELPERIQQAAESSLQLQISRDGESMLLEVTPEKSADDGRYRIGIAMKPDAPSERRRFGPIAAVSRSAQELVRLTTLTFDAFRKMIVGRLSPKNLSGPIEIARFSSRALSSGFSSFFLLVAFISLQLGIVNLFPIPALDGGHLMIFTLEAILRRDFSMRLKEGLITAGFILLIGLMVFVILNDVAKALPGGWNSLLPF
ncbi:MAG: RIP metalloprotease RseP [Acidobacteriota bacterium]|jgi:regulator of sigma E protease|nr:RIP metalloprotease RseP [Acidobacteriota bacterium]